MESKSYRRKLLAVLVISLAGIAIALEAERIHRQLKTDAGFSSFCNVNHVINCDVVLSSRWAELAGVSVSAAATMFYLLVAALSATLLFQRNSTNRRRLVGVLVGLLAAGAAFSIYMAFIAFGVLRSFCMLCSGLYLVALANFVAGWRLHREVQVIGRKEKENALRRDMYLYTGVAATLLLVVGAAAWDVARSWNEPTSAAEVAQMDPRFADWFRRLPSVDLSVDSRNALGPADAPVTIVEFSDFECVHCAALRDALEETRRRFPALVRVVFRHFPLDSACNPLVASPFHPVACEAAAAAECAGAQGKFWQYHDLLFTHQKQLRRDRLRDFARELRLDLEAFDRCLQDPNTRARVAEDVRLGTRIGVNSTPTMVVNGKLVRGALDAETLRRTLLLAREESRTGH
jgi:protein-disulfide isomerase/uncharacterized membrane protein